MNNINYLENKISKLSDNDLSSKTSEFKLKLNKGKNTDDILVEAFAVVREARKRILNMRHFDVQIIGGIVLYKCCIAEMRTGEGKTLTATLPSYLNALTGNGVHIVTVNDYLAKRDAENNRNLFEFLGLTVGVNLQSSSQSEKKNAYNADITYGTNNEYGFDYLRDNMILDIKDKVQRPLHYALIDEVDSILIDEARTPLIISGAVGNNIEIYYFINKITLSLINKNQDYFNKFKINKYFIIDEKLRQVYLTEKGFIYIEKSLQKNKIIHNNTSLYLNNNIIYINYIISSLKAHLIFIKNKDYIVQNNEVIIVDEHTGRTMSSRRWSDGVHQSIEAKENVTIKEESQTLASITLQNYFRLYKKLSGMTGTAITEAFEFNEIYHLDTIVIPTNKPMIRKDLPDIIYMTEKEKIKAIINDIKECYLIGRPVLVGTISIEKSELISNKLKEMKIPHNVLNAKLHAMEANIIAKAGEPHAVTIATNMAGRGTDIILGGNWRLEISQLKIKDEQLILNIKNKWKEKYNSLIKKGGLHIIGIERHESRRIDNQLRGRSGRQGDTGSSRFYLSMEDALIRVFASKKTLSFIKKLGIKENESIEHIWITKIIANAQKKIENYNFDIRKQLLEYDNVINDQRSVIYTQRNELLISKDISYMISSIRRDVVKKIFDDYIYSKFSEEDWDILGLKEKFKNDMNIDIPILDYMDNKHNLKNDIEKIFKYIINKMIIEHKNKENIIGSNVIRSLEKSIMIQILDKLWKDHLLSLDYLRNGIHLQCYAQKDPKQEYKKQSFNMFVSMLEILKYEVTIAIHTLNIDSITNKVKIHSF